jgi:hypothetical protein
VEKGGSVRTSNRGSSQMKFAPSACGGCGLLVIATAPQHLTPAPQSPSWAYAPNRRPSRPPHRHRDILRLHSGSLGIAGLAYREAGSGSDGRIGRAPAHLQHLQAAAYREGFAGLGISRGKGARGGARGSGLGGALKPSM